MTIGDVLAVIAAVFVLGASWAATLLIVALAFPARVAKAQAVLTEKPGGSLARGLAILLVGGLLAAVLWNAAAGGTRLLSGLILAALSVLAAVGSAGVVRLLAERIDALGSPMLPFAGLTRAAALYVVAGFLPVIGWFFLLPAALLLSVGSGLSALWPVKRPRPASLPVPETLSVPETAA